MIRIAVVVLAGGCHLAFPLEDRPALDGSDAGPRIDPCAVPSGLVLCIDFEQPAGEVLFLDRSPEGNHATASRPLEHVPRGDSTAVRTIEDATISVGQHDSLDAPFGLTLDLWFAPDTVPGIFAGLIDNDAQYGISFEPDRTVKCALVIETVVHEVPSRTLPDFDWHHVACVRRGNMLEVYIDGQRDRMKDVGAGAAQIESTQPVYLGGEGDGSGMPMNPYSGMLDDIRIFTRDLSAAELLQYYEATR